MLYDLYQLFKNIPKRVFCAWFHRWADFDRDRYPSECKICGVSYGWRVLIQILTVLSIIILATMIFGG